MAPQPPRPPVGRPTAPPPPPVAQAAVDLGDLPAAWAAVVSALETSNAWAWLDQVEFARGGLDDQGVLQLVIRPRPAAGGVARIATADRLDRLAAQTTSILGKRARYKLEAPRRGGGGSEGPGAAHAAAGKLGSRVAAEAAEANAQRQEAMGQPLVRAVLSVFPDAVLVKASKKPPKPAPPPEA